MPDTSTHPPAHPVVSGSSGGAQINLPPLNASEVEAALNTFVNVLPILATFFPPLAAVIPFIPVIKGLLTMAGELQKVGGDPQAIVQVLAQHLQTITTQVQAALPQQPAAPPPPAPSE